MLTVLLAAVLLAGAADAEPADAQQGPRVRAESSIVDLGQVARGTVPRARFALHSVGDDVLRIVDAKPG